MATERIEVLKSILLDLHNGASAESVQELFNEHFTGVSAIEISLMEHELMNSDTGVTFEDVMSLCNAWRRRGASSCRRWSNRELGIDDTLVELLRVGWTNLYGSLDCKRHRDRLP